ncbi:type I-F CRISPR-associated protein Csy1 [Pararobbsia alpina]|uniref:CRISPR-associated protein Csy1 n=1 Tax=Pararobbsia alpina TaxID=621374 RepID=A0A6S7D327_9BURK|nr:type I-F CRISPR-associated protein Csy1 [Pararobbsia alpina]CAB3804950.1 CRISPR-associated protein Csy1 [Pararobbsia alpina]
MDAATHALSHGDSRKQLRETILNFLQERLQSKLDKLKDDDADQREKFVTDFLPENWISFAARRVLHIQQVTHALKFTHPDARGSSLSVAGNLQVGELHVGTHTLGGTVVPDVVGDAAALDVYKFLRLIVDGRSLLERAIANDPALAAALSDHPEQASRWMAAFASLTQSKGQLASHELAKQIYWPLGGGQYHLLAPLFPTSLVHVVWNTLQEDRYADAAKAARDARRAGVSHPQGYREYPDVAVQKFGGSKPQNISQLNSERHGENYLVPSLPPSWHREPIRPSLGMASVFHRLFGRRPCVREVTRILREFRGSAENADSSRRVRNKRAELVAYVRDELLQFGAEMHELKAGWSLQLHCRLNTDEQCWLDPRRAESDEVFASMRCRGDWRDGVCRRFGNWLNATLTTPCTPMGQAEAAHWADILEKELRMIRIEIDIDE